MATLTIVIEVPGNSDKPGEFHLQRAHMRGALRDFIAHMYGQDADELSVGGAIYTADGDTTGHYRFT
jgi:hypothetical protein